LAIKAVYQQHGWRFPFVHDLGQLLNCLTKNGLTLPADVQRADRLSDYAVQLRYPGPFPPVTQAEYEEAIQIAQAVLTWAETLVP
jgi:HEPN domain-containing protein